jgi:hypothetical protein
MMNHFGSAVNAIRERNGLECVNWEKEVASARVLFGVKVRGKKNTAVSTKKIVPYLKNIGLHSPVQFYVWAEETKNRGSQFYACVATVDNDWKANKGIDTLLYVRFVNNVMLGKFYLNERLLNCLGTHFNLGSGSNTRSDEGRDR